MKSRPYDVFGSWKCNVISLRGKLGRNTCAWFSPARYEIPWNRISLHSPLLPLVHEFYPITPPPHPRSKASNASALATKQIKESGTLLLLPRHLFLILLCHLSALEGMTMLSSQPEPDDGGGLEDVWTLSSRGVK